MRRKLNEGGEQANESAWDRLVDDGHVRMPAGLVSILDLAPLSLEAGLAPDLEELRTDER